MSTNVENVLRLRMTEKTGPSPRISRIGGEVNGAASSDSRTGFIKETWHVG